MFSRYALLGYFSLDGLLGKKVLAFGCNLQYVLDPVSLRHVCQPFLRLVRWIPLNLRVDCFLRRGDEAVEGTLRDVDL